MMKRRRISETKPSNASPVRRNSLAGGFYGVWSSTPRFRPNVASGNEDLCREKLNITIPEINHLSSSNLVASIVPDEATEAPNSDGPKTSEYAFFKKLKKGAGKSFNAYSLHREGNQLKQRYSCEDSGDCADRTKKIKQKNLKSSCLFDKVTPINLHSFPSPYRVPSKSLGKTKKPEPNHKSHKSSVLVEKAVAVNFDSFPSPFEGPAMSSGTQNLHEDVFCTRRTRLRRWAVDSSSPSTGEMNSNEYNLVSVLLSRLFPETESNENSCLKFEHPKLRKEEILHSENDGMIWKKLHGIAISEWVEPEYNPHNSDGSLGWRSNNSRKVTFSNWDSLGYNFSARHSDKIHFLDNKMEFDLDLDYRRNAKIYSETNTDLGYCVDYPASYDCMELDGSSNPIEPAFDRQAQTLLLDWNVNSLDNEHDSYFASQSTEPSSYLALSTSLSDSDWHNPIRFCFSPFLSNPPLHLLPPSYYNLDFQSHVLDDKTYSDPPLNHFPLSYAPNYLDLIEDMHRNEICTSPQNQSLFTRKISCDAYLPDGEDNCLPNEFDCSIEKWLSMTDSWSKHHLSTFSPFKFPQDESSLLCLSCNKEYKGYLDDSSIGGKLHHFNMDELAIYDPSSINFHISFQEEKNSFPSLLANSSWDGFERDIDSDD